jgi:hypothetical protein
MIGGRWMVVHLGVYRLFAKSMDAVRTLGGPGKNAMNLLARRQRAAAVQAGVLRRLDDFA